jgi:WD40 repeat protein
MYKQWISYVSFKLYRVWDIAKPSSPLCDFRNVHKSTASAISFSTFKPALLVSVSHDQRLNFYDVNDRKPIKTVMDTE